MPAPSRPEATEEPSMDKEDRCTLTILGGGNWGTTLALLACETQARRVRLWEYDADAAEAMRRTRENKRFLPGVRLPDELLVTSDPAEALDGAEVVVLALPSHVVRESLRRLRGLWPDGAVLLSASKGLECGSGSRMSEIACSELELSPERVAVLSGPNLAPEIAARMPSSTVIASSNLDLASRLQRLLSRPYFRIYTNDDVVGVEYGGALKNIYAIGAGILEGLGFGDNTKGALLTRGLAEMTRFGVHFGARPLTFLGLAGVGDLIATCSSPVSRNHRLGQMLARGVGVEECKAAIGMVAEGVNTTRTVHGVAGREEINMPITSAIHAILFEGKSPQKAIEELMNRELKREDEYGVAVNACGGE